MIKASARHGAYLAFLVLTLACAEPEGATAQAQSGEFIAKVTGAATTTLQGFALASGRAGVGWSLQMETPGADNIIMIVREGAGRPATGTYDLVDFTTKSRHPSSSDLVASVTLHDSVLPGNNGFNTVRGTLTVTASSATSVVGEFTLTAHHSRSPASGVTVKGSFKSRERSE